MQVVSSRAAAISGGSASVQLPVSQDARRRVELDGRDVGGAFRRSGRSGELLGLVQGLRIGTGTLTM